MSKSRFTPGPWRAHDHNDMAEFGDDPSDWIGYAWVGFGGDDDGRFQGKLANLDRRHDGSTEFRQRASADARLIAKAPELYELVKEFMNWTNQHPVPHPYDAFIAARRLLAEIDGEKGKGND